MFNFEQRRYAPGPWPVGYAYMHGRPARSFQGLGQPPGATSVPPWCGGIKPLQQMLQDLGLYTGKIDGDAGTGTLNAVVAFAKQHGLPTTGITKSYCNALIDAWNAKMATPPAPEPGAPPVPGAPAAPAPDAGAPNGPMVLAEQQGVMAKWQALPTAAKVGIVGGAVLVLGGTIYLIAR
jgi:hypothetical protein